MNRIWHRIVRQRPTVGTLKIEPAWGLLALLLLAGCATQPPPMPVPPPPAVSQGQAHHPKAPRATTSKQHVSCAWSQVHGIAELVAIRDHHATYRFYPGNTLFRKPHPPQNASPGNEYKAIVRRPMSGPCDVPELVVVDPLE